MTPDHNHLVRIIRDSTHEVFSTMLNIELEQADAYIDSSTQPSGDGIAAFVGLAGSWVGTGSVSCSAAFACQMSSQFLMAEYHAVNEDVLDAVAEVTNMIIGNVKTRLEEDLGPMGLSIPTVIYGRNFTSRTVGSCAWTVVPFTAGRERMEIQVFLAPHKEKLKPAHTRKEDEHEIICCECD
jgi:chemotaxis protein CheX